MKKVHGMGILVTCCLLLSACAPAATARPVTIVETVQESVVEAQPTVAAETVPTAAPQPGLESLLPASIPGDGWELFFDTAFLPVEAGLPAVRSARDGFVRMWQRDRNDLIWAVLYRFDTTEDAATAYQAGRAELHNRVVTETADAHVVTEDPSGLVLHLLRSGSHLLLAGSLITYDPETSSPDPDLPAPDPALVQGLVDLCRANLPAGISQAIPERLRATGPGPACAACLRLAGAARLATMPAVDFTIPLTLTKGTLPNGSVSLRIRLVEFLKIPDEPGKCQATLQTYITSFQDIEEDEDDLGGEGDLFVGGDIHVSVDGTALRPPNDYYRFITSEIANYSGGRSTPLSLITASQPDGHPVPGDYHKVHLDCSARRMAFSAKIMVRDNDRSDAVDFAEGLVEVFKHMSVRVAGTKVALENFELILFGRKVNILLNVSPNMGHYDVLSNDKDSQEIGHGKAAAELVISGGN